MTNTGAAIWYGRFVPKITVYLDEELVSKLNHLARAENRSRSELVREALRAYVREVAHHTPVGIGAYSSGRSDVSERTEDILRTAARTSRLRL